MLEAIALRVPRFILGTLVFTGIAINFANVVGRYLFSTPFVWAEEVLVQMMIWCVFVGTVLVTWEGRHIKMDLFSAGLRPPWRQLSNGLMALVFVVVCLFVAWHSWTLIAMVHATGQTSVIARLPMSLVLLSMLIGFVLMALAVLLRLRAYLSGSFGSDAEVTALQLQGLCEAPQEAGERQ